MRVQGLLGRGAAETQQGDRGREQDQQAVAFEAW